MIACIRYGEHLDNGSSICYYRSPGLELDSASLSELDFESFTQGFDSASSSFSSTSTTTRLYSIQRSFYPTTLLVVCTGYPAHTR
jgi:hypothetical protein